MNTNESEVCFHTCGLSFPAHSVPRQCPRCGVAIFRPLTLSEYEAFVAQMGLEMAIWQRYLRDCWHGTES